MTPSDGRRWIALLGLAAGTVACSDSPEKLPAQTSVHSTRPICSPGNGGLALPAGFCALVVGRELGPVRHLVIAPNGDVFANVEGQGVLALRDTSGDGAADVVRRLGGRGGTGIALGAGHLYFSTDDAVYRYPWREGQLEPAGDPETIVRGLPAGGDHTSKSIALGRGDTLFVNLGSATNSCQERNRQARSPGLDPCRELETRAGIWRFSASRRDQRFQDGERYATGLRNTVALAVEPATGALYGVVHGRDQLTQNWGFSAEKGAANPGEELVRIERGDDFGWPYCYYDVDAGRKVLAPEYGGNGREVGRCAGAKEPLLVFPGHWAPMAIAFGTARQFGSRYEQGVFVAFHGSWNRAPLPQAGYRVVWAPFAGGRPRGTYETFATGTAGPTALRASGLALGPDGSLYLAADASATIWRIMRATAAQGGKEET